MQCKVSSIEELIASGDLSICFKIVTEKSGSYHVPRPTMDVNDVASASENLKQAFIQPKNVRSPERSITVMRNVFVLPNAAIVTPSGHIIKESCFPYTGIWIGKFFSTWIKELDEHLEVDLKYYDMIDQPTVYVREHGESGFFHWMHSVYPRLDVFNDHNFSANYRILCKSETIFQREGLDLLGITEDIVTTPSMERPQFFRELLFPSALVEDGDFFLRPPSIAKFYDSLPLSGGISIPRIYLSRGDADTRRVSNEDQLVDGLKSFGFVKVEIGNMSFIDQLRLFRNCEFIVSPHGAGLSHIIGMRPGSGVTEILHPRRFWPTFRAIAARRGLSYGVAVGEDISSEDNDTFDFSVSVDKAVALVRSQIK